MDNALALVLVEHVGRMGADLIVSYDGTSNDEDAVALGRLLAGAGARVALAYVRHNSEMNPQREQIAQHDAEALLERGALALNGAGAARHVLLDPSTPAGLNRLADHEGASIIVFGSDYRTSPGRAEPGASAQQLLEGGSVAVAVAAVGLRAIGAAALRTIALHPGEGDPAGMQTAQALASKLGADLVEPDGGADLVVVPSRINGTPGRIDLSGAARSALNTVRGSVLVVPCGAAPAL